MDENIKKSLEDECMAFAGDDRKKFLEMLRDNPDILASNFLSIIYTKGLFLAANNGIITSGNSGDGKEFVAHMKEILKEEIATLK